MLAVLQISQIWYTAQFLFQSLTDIFSTTEGGMSRRVSVPRVHLHFLPGRLSYCETVHINAIYIYICVYTFWRPTAVWWSQTVLFSSGRTHQFVMLVSSWTQICHKILWISNVLNVYVCVHVHTYIIHVYIHTYRYMQDTKKEKDSNKAINICCFY